MKKESVFDLDKESSVIFKGIAILLVLLGHLGFIYRGGAFGANLFLVLSGYGIFRSFKKNGVKNYFGKKITKIYIPYLLVSLVVVPYSFFSHLVTRRAVLYSFIGIDFGYLCDKTMWYISFIFVFYIVFYLLARLFSLIKKEHIIDFLIIICLFLFSYLLYIKNFEYLFWDSDSATYLYMYSFSFGVLLSKLGEFKINNVIRKIIYSILCIVAIYLCIYYYGKVSGVFKYFVYASTVPIAILSLPQIISINYKSKVLTFFGNYSFYIYLWEGFLISLKRRIFVNISGNFFINVLTFIVIIAISVLFDKLIIKKVNNSKLVKLIDYYC